MVPSADAKQDDASCLIASERHAFHVRLAKTLLRTDAKGIASIADRGNKYSIAIAERLFAKLGADITEARMKGQSSGRGLEIAVHSFLENTFPKLGILRCGDFRVRPGAQINKFEQYEHLSDISAITKLKPELRIALGGDYLVKPDVVITREPETDDAINSTDILVDDTIATLTSIRFKNNKKPILHASISCKLTIRSDRVQNSRSEALNLIRNRKGRLPHIAVVTAEPAPSRIASIAFGTGDIDCVYHVALLELREAIEELGFVDALDLIDLMIKGKRLRDISDLPLDLAI